MSGLSPISIKTTRRLITVFLALFVLDLFIALKQAHCEVVKPAALYLSLGAADYASTEWAIRNGSTERNGFMRTHPVPKQIAVAGLLTAADVALQKRGHHKKLRVLVTVARLTFVAINVANARRER